MSMWTWLVLKSSTRSGSLKKTARIMQTVWDTSTWSVPENLSSWWVGQIFENQPRFFKGQQPTLPWRSRMQDHCIRPLSSGWDCRSGTRELPGQKRPNEHHFPPRDPNMADEPFPSHLPWSKSLSVPQQGTHIIDSWMWRTVLDTFTTVYNGLVQWHFDTELPRDGKKIINCHHNFHREPLGC